MDIFYVLNSRFPTIKAYGLQVAKTCEGLKNSGASVRLIVPIRKRHKEIKGISSFKLYGIKNRFRIIKLPSLDFSWLHLDNKLFFAVQQATFALLTIIYVIFSGKRGVIYSRDQFSLYIFSFLRRNLFWEVHTFPEHINSGLYKRLLKSLSGIIVISSGLRTKFIEAGYAPEKLLVAPDAIEPDEFNISETSEQAKIKLNLPLDKKIIMYIGHLFEWKGADILVEAARFVGPDVKVVVGGGTEQDVAKLKQMDHTGRVRFDGFVKFYDLPLYLRAADVLVLPNKKDNGVSEFYTSPLKLFAYMASGKPIVSSDLPSLREIVTEESVFFVEPNNPKSLAKTITAIINNPLDAESRSHKALEIAAAHSWKNRGDQINKFIQQLA